MAGYSRHPFRMHESTLGIETLPQQTGVYIPRHLDPMNGFVMVPLGHQLTRRMQGGGS
jgi:hypothetical protein